MDKTGGMLRLESTCKLKTRIPVGKLITQSLCQSGQLRDRNYTAYLEKKMGFQYKELLTSKTWLTTKSNEDIKGSSSSQ